MDSYYFEQSLLLISSSCFILLLLLIYIYTYISRSSAPTKTTSVPPKSFPLIGTLLDFIKNRNRFLEWITEIILAAPTNTVLLHRPGMPPFVMTANPSNVKHVLMTNFDRYPKGELFISRFHDVFGQGMFVLDGEPWKDQRRIAVHEIGSNTFRNSAMETIADAILTALIPILESSTRMNHVLDLQDIFEHIMFIVTYKLVFGEDPDTLSNDRNTSTTFLEAFKESILLSNQRFQYLVPFMWKVKRFLNIGSEQRLKDSISIMHMHLERTIRAKLVQTRGMTRPQDNNVISRFINHGDTRIEYLRDVGMGFILAGMDTVASGLTWFFWLLSSNPRVEKRIVEEVEAIRAKHGKNLEEIPTYEELREMHYLQAAITESMRLYPPVIYEVRECNYDDVLPDGTLVKKGWHILYNSFAMGRMEKIWGRDCLEYKPERWLEDGIFRQESPFHFPIFNAGPRLCVGKDLAYVEMKLIAALIIEKFVIEVQDNRTFPEKVLSLTLQMKGGLPVKLRERCPEYDNKKITTEATRCVM